MQPGAHPPRGSTRTVHGYVYVLPWLRGVTPPGGGRAFPAASPKFTSTMFTGPVRAALGLSQAQGPHEGLVKQRIMIIGTHTACSRTHGRCGPPLPVSRCVVSGRHYGSGVAACGGRRQQAWGGSCVWVIACLPATEGPASRPAGRALSSSRHGIAWKATRGATVVRSAR